MKHLLLDTNAFAMVLTADRRLPASVLKLILEASDVSISAISLYEIGQKVRLGKWSAMCPYAPDLIDIARGDHIGIIPVTPLVSLEASLLDWQHRDPFDRMIAVTAMREQMPLISSDEAFDGLETISRIWD